MEKVPSTLLSFFWYCIRPHKYHVAGLMLVATLWALNVSLLPYVLKLLINTVTGYSGDLALLWHALFWPAACYIAFSLMLGLTFRFYDYLILTLVPNLRRDIQQSMLFYLEGHSYQYFQNNFAGSLSNKISDMMRSMPEILLLTTDAFLGIFLALCFSMVTMYFVHPVFSLILLCWSIIYCTVSYLFSLKGKSYATLLAETKSTLSGKQVDSISNIVNVRLFARRAFEVKYVRTYTNHTMNADRTLQWYLLKVRIFQFLSMSAITALMLFFLIQTRSQNLITIGDFVLILTLTTRLMDSLWNVSQNLIRFAQEVGTCTQALNIITPPHGITDVPNAPPLQVTEGKITFEQVTFHYTQANAIFKNKNVVIEPHTKVGLVGFSGSGKTTFVNLILRFFDVESGRILIDGQDISQVTQDSLHEQIAMIPQDTSLFHRTLMENIRYGNIHASDAEVLEASKRAHCDEFIRELPQGYDSLVGERGIKLSGGQRQRIAIARAILKNAPILILDEATSALDSVTEKHIQAGLHALMQHRTTIVIAHRLSTLSEMDRILVFDKGRIIEDGTHKELLKQKGHYAKMWEMQAGGFLPEQE